MENNLVLLSICIPTYNRASILGDNLEALYNQIYGEDLPIELLVSDNCSTDNTSQVVERYIEMGLSINYIRNKINIGMDGNFAQCYRKAKGKYVLVLGDDDYLIKGKLKKLLNYLSSDDYGLVHLKTDSKTSLENEVFLNSNKYLKSISYWITYITSNIVNSKYIKEYDFEKYFGTYLTIMPLYVNAAIQHQRNLIIYERIFKDGIVSNENGGYNFFEVFLENYLQLWKSFIAKNVININLYRWIKHDILKKFLIPKIYSLLIVKKANNYKLDNSWRYLLKYYIFCPYFYIDLFVFLINYIIGLLICRKK